MRFRLRVCKRLRTTGTIRGRTRARAALVSGYPQAPERDPRHGRVGSGARLRHTGHTNAGRVSGTFFLRQEGVKDDLTPLPHPVDRNDRTPVETNAACGRVRQE